MFSVELRTLETCLMPWDREFDDAVPLPGAKRLATLEDAARYIQRLLNAEQRLPHWQLAAETLINCAEGRDLLLHERIAALRALNQEAGADSRTRKKAKAYRIVK